ncbi:transcriptional regulator [Yersinia enterocolitica]|uniref:helix-turn-helix transcriptional regulator n=1 Tax=Yersinia enterocolitica TaxID=630 RepID=UPI000659BBEB|nr:helix-turn-helix domain-containing protein [Yersinia enterocolitica]EKN3848742.1 transcriptional regulator [Yersinia enterocolitica]EKN6407756.1 transcriptional regulator [Yersinia enterocolitica]ELI8071937.1 transcriptional regulator [Yersinia enterocolitica]CRX50682.1 Antitoxin HigA-1 [Yersinia enterocolitica]HEN3376427.1 transcriptional regulator [Yersinia enterocolitica]
MDTISREPTTVAVMLVEEFMNPTSISQPMLAEELGLSIERVRAICEGTDRINVKEISLLAAFFDTNPEFWFNVQDNLSGGYYEIKKPASDCYAGFAE